jgi:hypothetical protein
MMAAPHVSSVSGSARDLLAEEAMVAGGWPEQKNGRKKRKNRKKSI